MQSIEDIIANAQIALAASLRVAYDAGREHQTAEMRDKFVAFFEGVIAPFSAQSAPVPSAAAQSEPEEAPPAPVEAAPEAPPAEAVAAEPASEPAEDAPAAEPPATAESAA